jgi:hypothetical protein
MSNYLQHFYEQLYRRLNELRGEAARYAGDIPLRLRNQIDDHEQAIELTGQLIEDRLSLADWQSKLAVLAVDKPDAERLQARPSQTAPASRPFVWQRCADLNGHIGETLELIRQYEEQRRLADDPRAILRAEKAIAGLKAQLAEHQSEAQELGCPAD